MPGILVVLPAIFLDTGTDSQNLGMKFVSRSWLEKEQDFQDFPRY